VTVPAGRVSGRDISALLRSRPGPAAPVSVLAAWLTRKADLLDRIADASGDQALIGEARARAATARQSVQDLTTTSVGADADTCPSAAIGCGAMTSGSQS
jgi:hypothetical protein